MDETGLVNLAISHSVLSISNEKRFERSMTIGTLKEKLYRLTGTHPASMELELWDDGGAKVADMLDDDATLASFAPYDYCRVHVVDTNPAELAALTDVSQIEKYVMPDEKYDKLGESYRRWKKLNIPGAADERRYASCFFFFFFFCFFFFFFFFVAFLPRLFSLTIS
jgi:tubulin-folding cofactor B